MTTTQEQQTALYQWHIDNGAKMVSFAGYSMPVQYISGIIKEHKQTRDSGGVFDVSHMGQITVSGANAIAELERVFAVDLESMQPGDMRYSFFLNETGGILDDLMITRRKEDWYLVVNAGCKYDDFDRLKKLLPTCDVNWIAEQALNAVQGPAAVNAVTRFIAGVDALTFMHAGEFSYFDQSVWVSRSGYTGEDGVEISLPNALVETLAQALIEQDELKPAGLGCRDSLRLEAGLCLYGHDLNENISPVEAALTWAISPSRRASGKKAGGYLGAEAIAEQVANGVAQKRIGLMVESKRPVREGSILQDENGVIVGQVTSGGFSPSLETPIAMGYVNISHTEKGQKLFAQVRDKLVPVTVVAMPFLPHRYVR